MWLNRLQVKLVKCLVDNIVVDISFQSLGGLCTVNFLESIDRRIDDHHLFKRSIILVLLTSQSHTLFQSLSFKSDTFHPTLSHTLRIHRKS